jgi:hypothetical protein
MKTMKTMKYNKVKIDDLSINYLVDTRHEGGRCEGIGTIQ